MRHKDEIQQIINSLIEKSNFVLAEREFPDRYRRHLSRFLIRTERLAQLLEMDGVDYSHELKTCIGPIMGYPQLILYEATIENHPCLNDLHHQSIETLQQNTNHLLRLINDALLPPKV